MYARLHKHSRKARCLMTIPVASLSNGTRYAGVPLRLVIGIS